VIFIWTTEKTYMWLSHAESKWYMSQEQLPDRLVPRGKPYLAGWAYVLSHDFVKDLVALVTSFAVQPAMRPGASSHACCTLVSTPDNQFEGRQFMQIVCRRVQHNDVSLVQSGCRGFSGRTSWLGCLLTRLWTSQSPMAVRI
jgi:hypothetical protein